MAIGRRPIPRTCGAQASAASAGLSCVEAASATPLATPAGLSISCIDLGRRELSVVSGGGAAALTRDGRVWLPEAIGTMPNPVIRSDALPSGRDGREIHPATQRQERDRVAGNIWHHGHRDLPGGSKEPALVKHALWSRS